MLQADQIQKAAHWITWIKDDHFWGPKNKNLILWLYSCHNDIYNNGYVIINGYNLTIFS